MTYEWVPAEPGVEIWSNARNLIIRSTDRAGAAHIAAALRKSNARYQYEYFDEPYWYGPDLHPIRIHPADRVAFAQALKAGVA